MIFALAENGLTTKLHFTRSNDCDWVDYLKRASEKRRVEERQKISFLLYIEDTRKRHLISTRYSR